MPNAECSLEVHFGKEEDLEAGRSLQADPSCAARQPLIAWRFAANDFSKLRRVPHDAGAQVARNGLRVIPLGGRSWLADTNKFGIQRREHAASVNSRFHAAEGVVG